MIILCKKHTINKKEFEVLSRISYLKYKYLDFFIVGKKEPETTEKPLTTRSLRTRTKNDYINNKA